MKQDIPNNSLFFFVLSVVTMMLLILTGLGKTALLEIITLV